MTPIGPTLMFCGFKHIEEEKIRPFIKVLNFRFLHPKK